MSGTVSENSRPLESESSRYDGTWSTGAQNSIDVKASVDPEKGSLDINFGTNTLSATKQDHNDSNIVSWDSQDDPENPLKYDTHKRRLLFGEVFLVHLLLRQLY